ncbi:hypothetical protein B5G28_04705 [Faecalibacterium sp. An77]|uniref:hypothetical protein n=1 Tax=Faecalibacterium sp. An77 TaxID=1965655 RepID=UPI000B38FCAC|nr:hypothetical protein [Faecalibacterium sp. An77]OUN39625.1 hypothetical protein B5G28_04705 [Faecalibacterium sp. An77]
MASQYLNWKLRDVKPDPPPPDPTPPQKWRNWWHYHKGMVIAGMVVGLAVLDIAHSALGLGQVRPDYQVAYVGENALPDATAAAIEEAFAALGSDANPYDRGCSAFAVYQNFVFVAELTCQKDFGGDVEQILSDVLDGVHYSADLT